MGLPLLDVSEEKPEDMVCPICERTCSFNWNSKYNEWELDCEWYFIPGDHDFLCSVRCWRKARKEGYYSATPKE